MKKIKNVFFGICFILWFLSYVIFSQTGTEKFFIISAWAASIAILAIMVEQFLSISGIKKRKFFWEEFGGFLLPIFALPVIDFLFFIEFAVIIGNNPRQVEGMGSMKFILMNIALAIGLYFIRNVSALVVRRARTKKEKTAVA